MLSAGGMHHAAKSPAHADKAIAWSGKPYSNKYLEQKLFAFCEKQKSITVFRQKHR